MWDFFFSSTHVEWLTLVLLNKLSIDCSSWVGLLEDKDFIHPNLVLQAHDFFHFCCIFLQQPIPFMLTSRSLHWAPNSYLSNFKVSTAKHGYRIILKCANYFHDYEMSSTTHVLLLLDRLQTSTFHFGHWEWFDGNLLLNGTSKKEHEYFNSFTTFNILVQVKWQSHLHLSNKLQWPKLQHVDRIKNEYAFLQSLWHKATFVNHWKTNINLSLDIDCPFCPLGVQEIKYDQFSDCPLGTRCVALSHKHHVHVSHQTFKRWFLEKVGSLLMLLWQEIALHQKVSLYAK